MLEHEADLSAARRSTAWAPRGRAVYEALARTAAESQAGVRQLLEHVGVAYEPYVITNAIHVEAGTRELAEALSTYDGVAKITAPVTYAPAVRAEAAADATEASSPAATSWGVQDIRAPQVWTDFTRGQGIVIGSIDTGVDWDHPALVQKYRGSQGSVVNHDYNWFDATGGGAAAPYDQVGYGTAAMGVMVGSAGANKIGVAPKAKWITANGCAGACTDQAVLAAAEWMLAPTRIDGSRPKAAKRPHIVDNDWATPPGDPFIANVLNAWAASGIFGVFANGDGGPSCGSRTWPADTSLAYSAGAYDEGHEIAVFSARGPGNDDSDIKPDMAAPGVNVRTALNNSSTYIAWGGTGVASAHVAGAAALLWAAAPSYGRNVSDTRLLLDNTAHDENDLSCGGTVDNNNVWGEGRLDAYYLVEAAVCGFGGCPAPGDRLAGSVGREHGRGLQS